MNGAEVLTSSPYVAYGYSYPHKTAYRPLPNPRRLREVWAGERKSGLFLYIHVPFCEMRCGFCNLFTTARLNSTKSAQAGDLREQYIDSLGRQATVVREELGESTFARLAIGGGTPTILGLDELERLMNVATQVMGARPEAIPSSVEVSPSTTSREKLALLRGFGVARISIGVQVFDETEVRALGRAQRRADVHRALELIRDAGFPTLNIDLIYGGDGQTVESWMATLEEALRYDPEEIYLYPLYIRPLTGLGLLGRAFATPERVWQRCRHRLRPRRRAWDDQRLAAYRAGRDFLKSRGYQQVSMRMFRAERAPQCEGPVYCCQRDGMVGLGAGARSYTRDLHYSGEYAIGRPNVLRIINDYNNSSDARFGRAEYGFVLDGEERRRRFVMKSLLQCQGLDRSAYANVFKRDSLADFPELGQLAEAGLAETDEQRVRLTDAGLERSDAIAPGLYSERVRNLMERYVWQ